MILKPKVAIPILILPLAIAGCALYSSGSEQILQQARLMMGTTIEIKASCRNLSAESKRAKEAIDKAFAEIARVEAVFSTYKDDSVISQINMLGPGEKLDISDEVFNLIARSIEYSKMTDGAFDITVKPLVDLWNECRRLERLPSQDEIDSALSKVGYRHIILDEGGKWIAFDIPGAKVDLGGVAKGYATDRAVQILKENGVKAAIVNSGGDMYCLGTKAGGRLWRAGIRHPREKEKMLLEVFLRDKAIDTSGDYEKFFMVDGRRFSHIIDPRTGWAVGDSVVSASVIAGDAAAADMLATALCILGAKGLDIADANGIAALIVLKSGDNLEITKSQLFKEFYDGKA